MSRTSPCSTRLKSRHHHRREFPGDTGRTSGRPLQIEALEDRRLLSVYSSSDVPESIPDNGNTTSMLMVPDALTIADINVTLDIGHTRDKDLDVYLRGPDGTRVELMTDVGGEGDDFTNTTFDDEAAVAITSGTAPFSGIFQPEGSLSDFDGKSSLGVWTLELFDDQKREGPGVLYSWSLDISSNQPAVSIDDIQQQEGDSGVIEFEFTVTRTGDISQSSKVDFTTANGTAAAGVDYIHTTGTVTFNPGDSSQSVIVSVNGDSEVEPDETFVVNLDNPVNCLIVNGQGQGTILDDDAVATILFPDFSDSDPDASRTDDLNLLGRADITVDHILRLTPAEQGLPGGAWSTEKQIVSAPFETTFEFQMTENFDAPGGSDGFVFLIQNDSVNALRGGGGNLGYNQIRNSIAIEFDTFLNADFGDPSHSHISVHTRGTAPNDTNEVYSLGSYVTSDFILDDTQVHSARVTYIEQILSIQLDDLGTVISVPIDIGDVLDLDYGRAWVGFTAATGGGYQNHDILNWTFTPLVDTTTVLAVEDVQQLEGNSGQTLLDFPVRVTRSDENLPATEITVSYYSEDGSAVAGEQGSGDYDSQSGVVSFNFVAGQTEANQTIQISVNGDDAEEAYENFFVRLSNASQGTIVSDTGVGTIMNDETTVSIDPVTVLEGNSSVRFIDDFVPLDTGVVDAPQQLVFGRDGNSLFVTSSATHEVLEFDAATGTFLGSFVTAGAGGLVNPFALTFGPDGNLYVTSRTNDNVLRYDGNTGDFIDEFVTSASGGLDNPNGLVFGEDGGGSTYLYVTSRSTDEVLRYDGETGDLIDVFISPGIDELDEPIGITIGPHDDQLYVSTGGNTDRVMRYDRSSGTFIGEFVTVHSGGLDRPLDLEFWEGDLYVTSSLTDSILHYDGVSGDFVEAYVPQGAGGLENPSGFAFGEDGNIYVANRSTYNVKRFGVASQAVFTASLSYECGNEVTVNYLTADGTAVAGLDYVASSGVIVFPPGVTERQILVSTIDDTIIDPDKDFSVELTTDTAGAVISATNGVGVATIIDNDASADTKFYVVDANADSTFEYDSSGNWLDGQTWPLANKGPEGAASNPAGDTLWVVDSNGTVYVYDPDGVLLGSWIADDVQKPKGIATDGQDIWILEGRTKDPLHKAVLFYGGGAFWRAGTYEAASSFTLPSVNENPTGITTDGIYVWITDDDSRNEDNIWVYGRDGGPVVGGFDLPAQNSKASGVTIDPTGASRNIWVVDSGADAIFEYQGAFGDEPFTLLATYPLGSGNTNPQGIADPRSISQDGAVSRNYLVDEMMATVMWPTAANLLVRWQPVDQSLQALAAHHPRYELPKPHLLPLVGMPEHTAWANRIDRVLAVAEEDDDVWDELITDDRWTSDD